MGMSIEEYDVCVIEGSSVDWSCQACESQMENELIEEMEVEGGTVGGRKRKASTELVQEEDEVSKKVREIVREQMAVEACNLKRQLMAVNRRVEVIEERYSEERLVSLVNKVMEEKITDRLELMESGITEKLGGRINKLEEEMRSSLEVLDKAQVEVKKGEVVVGEEEGEIIDYLKEYEGDLFKEGQEYAFAHCVASDFQMSRGIADEFRERYGGVKNLLKQNTEVGGVAKLEREGRVIYYLVTKEKSWDLPKLEDIESSLVILRDKCIAEGVFKLAMPRLASGRDRCDWAVIRKIINRIFVESGIEVKVCFVTQKTFVFGDWSVGEVQSSDVMEVKADGRLKEDGNRSDIESLRVMVKESEVTAMEAKVAILYLGEVVTRMAYNGMKGAVNKEVVKLVVAFKEKFETRRIIVVGAVPNSTIGNDLVGNINRELREICKGFLNVTCFIDPKGWLPDGVEMVGEGEWGEGTDVAAIVGTLLSRIM
jgi:hypothetical protein